MMVTGTYDNIRDLDGLGVSGGTVIAISNK